MRRAVYVVAALLVLTAPSNWAVANAQTPFYREAKPAGSAVIPNTSPAFERSVLDDYVAFMEWYFEMRFTPEERARYDVYLINDWNTNPVYRNNLLVTAKEMRRVRSLPYLVATGERANTRASGATEAAMLQMAGGGQPRELLNAIKASAASGLEETQFLLAVIEKAERPLVRRRDMTAQPFTRQHVDSLADLLAFRANAVAGKKVIEPTESMRDQLQTFLIDYWNANPKRQGEIWLWLFGAHVDWHAIKHAGYAWPTTVTTPYRTRLAVRNWADQVATWFPDLKTHADRRIAEYNAYVAKMSIAEMEMEMNIQRGRMARDQAAVTSMRNQMTKQHVVNMNGIEGIGGGREWEYRTVAQ
jgi:hypothetical protein